MAETWGDAEVEMLRNHVQALADERDGYRSVLTDLVAATRGCILTGAGSTARQAAIRVLRNGPVRLNGTEKP